jgi:hypothetical protein
MLGRLDLAGHRIVEFLATLEARLLGRSKMRVLRTVSRHLSLLAHIVGLRLRAAGACPNTTLARAASE